MSDISQRPLPDHFRIGSVLKTSLSILLRNAVSFLLVAAIIGIPALILLGAIAFTANVSDTLQIVLTVLLVIVAFLTFLMIVVALTYGTIQDLRGRRPGIRAIVSHALSAVLPASGTAVLLWLATSIGMALLIVPGIILLCMFYVALPVVVVERPGVLKSFSRSAELTKGNRWGLFVLILISYAISAVAEGVSGMFDETSEYALIGAGIALLLLLFSMTWSAVLVAVAYHDLRTAKEGLDTAQIAAIFD